MQFPSYSIQQSDDESQFFFDSIGPKGLIKKSIVFTLISENVVFNLALGDHDLQTGEFDDQTVSDNGDTAKILATVFQAAYAYLLINPSHTIYIQGNTPARNRLYRMAINRAWEELSTYFAMFGLCEGSWEQLMPNRSYESFLIQKK